MSCLTSCLPLPCKCCSFRFRDIMFIFSRTFTGNKVRRPRRQQRSVCVCVSFGDKMAQHLLPPKAKPPLPTPFTHPSADASLPQHRNFCRVHTFMPAQLKSPTVSQSVATTLRPMPPLPGRQAGRVATLSPCHSSPLCWLLRASAVAVSKFHFHTIKTGRIVWIEIDRCNY